MKSGESGETAYRITREGNVLAFHWIDKGLGFALSAEASYERLLSIVETVYRQIKPPAISDLVAAPLLVAKTLHCVNADFPRRSFFILQNKGRYSSVAARTFCSAFLSI